MAASAGTASQFSRSFVREAPRIDQRAYFQTFRDLTYSLGLAAGATLVEGAPRPPPGQPPQGGVPFGSDQLAGPRHGGGRLAAAAAAAVGLFALTR